MPPSHRPTALLIVALTVCAGLGLGAHQALAAAAATAMAAPAGVVFTVTSTLDFPDLHPGNGKCETDPNLAAAGACTLRAAVMEADLASNLDGALIRVPAGIYSLTIPRDITDGADNGDLNLTAGNPIVISIVGAGAASTIIDASHNDRVLSVEANRTAAISGVTLRGGAVGNTNGGGILNGGALTLDHVTISGNLATASNGGGIFNTFELTMTDSTLGLNNSGSYGGGLANYHSAVLDRSTVYGNSAQVGGGIFNSGPQGLVLINTTISTNNAGSDAGGIYNLNLANVYNSTIVFNGADTEVPISPAAGGVASASSGTFNIRNTLLAGNYHASDISTADCTGIVHAYGQNLFSVQSPCTVDSPDGGGWAPVNSFDLIGPLRDNGGPTWTHALLAGSNAINGGDPINGCIGPSGVLPTDQRGVPRIVDGVCDIGAFEFLPPAAYLPFVAR